MEWFSEEALKEELLQTIMTVVQDGICFLTKELDILYTNPAMEFWYSMNQSDVGKKCYEAYHGRKTPCENCPVLRAIHSGRPETGDQVYETNQRREGWQRIFCAPITDNTGEIVFVIEYIRDVTNEKKTALSVEFLQNQIDNLTNQMQTREEEEKKKHSQVVGNMKRSIGSVLSYLEKILDEQSFSLVRSQLDVTASGIGKEETVLDELSEKELLVARYIAEGYLSKEIADSLMISKKTVDYHRTNIRKKLGLKDGESLTAYLKKHLPS